MTDSLTVYLSGDAWRGAAQAQVTVNDGQASQTFAVTAAEASDDVLGYTLTGDFGRTPKVTVAFVNDASGGTASTDRNLYLDGFSYNGVDQLGFKKPMYYNQAATYTLSSNPAVAARAADFVDALGVNVHLEYTDTSYANFNLVEDRIEYLGVDRVRVGLPTAETLPKLLKLAADGVRFDVLLPAKSSSALLPSQLATLHAIAPYINAVEGPNETNLTASFSWNGRSDMAAAADYQRALFSAIRADPALSSLAVYASTLGAVGSDAYKALGSLSASSTYGNQHVYFADGASPRSNVQYALGLSAISNPGEKVVFTETNYATAPKLGGNVSDGVQARYDLDLLMDAAQAGVAATYLYELLDQKSDPTGSNLNEHWGLFNVDGTPKPAATAIHNLTQILDDDGKAAATFQPGSLSYSVKGLPSSGNSLLMEKSDGTFELALWAEPKLWDAKTGTEVAAPVRTVQIHLASAASSIDVFDPLVGTTPIAHYANASAVTVQITDHPLVLQIGSAPPDTTPPIVTLTQAGGVTRTTLQTVSGTVADANAAGTTVSIYENAASTAIGSAVVGADGSWSTTVTLAPGQNNLVAKASDKAGNVGVSDAVSYTLKTKPDPIRLGRGADVLTLHLSEDAFRGDAQFIVSVDGQQIGDVQTVTASHASGAPQDLELAGNFASGHHQANVTFINDLYQPGVGDRNLYLDGASLNGHDIAGAGFALMSAGTQAVPFGDQPADPLLAHLGSGPDTLTLHLSEDAFLGNAQFRVSIDGQQIGDVQTVTAKHAGGTSQDLEIAGSFGSGLHQASVTFINDLYQPGVGDRNLYLDGASLNGHDIAGASSALMSAGTRSITFGNQSTDRLLAHLGSGPDTLTLHLSEDAFLGNAQFRVSVDGQQVGDVQTVTAKHAGGASQDLEIVGNFGSGHHQASVTFINDLYQPGVGDRNLYLDGASLNGHDIAGASFALMCNGTRAVTF